MARPISSGIKFFDERNYVYRCMQWSKKGPAILMHQTPEFLDVDRISYKKREFFHDLDEAVRCAKAFTTVHTMLEYIYKWNSPGSKGYTCLRNFIVSEAPLEWIIELILNSSTGIPSNNQLVKELVNKVFRNNTKFLWNQVYQLRARLNSPLQTEQSVNESTGRKLQETRVMLVKQLCIVLSIISGCVGTTDAEEFLTKTIDLLSDDMFGDHEIAFGANVVIRAFEALWQPTEEQKSLFLDTLTEFCERVYDPYAKFYLVTNLARLKGWQAVCNELNEGERLICSAPALHEYKENQALFVTDSPHFYVLSFGTISIMAIGTEQQCFELPIEKFTFRDARTGYCYTTVTGGFPHNRVIFNYSMPLKDLLPPGEYECYFSGTHNPLNPVVGWKSLKSRITIPKRLKSLVELCIGNISDFYNKTYYTKADLAKLPGDLRDPLIQAIKLKRQSLLFPLVIDSFHLDSW